MSNAIQQVWGTLSRVFNASPHALILFRVCTGCFIVADAVMRYPDLVAHYTDQGVLPKDAAMLGREWYSYCVGFHSLVSGEWGQNVLSLLYIVMGTLLALGVRTRLMFFACWLFTLSLHNSNPFVLHRADDLLRFMLFWSCFIDWQQVESANKNDRIHGLGVAAVMLQPCVMYFSVVFAREPWAWLSGSTQLENALRFEPMARPAAERLLELSPSALHLLSACAFFGEFLAPTLLIIPSKVTRGLGFALVSGLSIAFGVTFQVGLFPVACIIAVIAYLPFSMVIESKGRVLNWPNAGSLCVLIVILASFGCAFLTSFQVPGYRLLSRGLSVVGLDQDWRIFHRPPSYSSWLVVRSKIDGEIRLLAPPGSRGNEKPNLNALIPNYRWRRLQWSLMSHSARSQLLGFYARYHLENCGLDETEVSGADDLDVVIISRGRRFGSTEEMWIERAWP